MQRSPSSSKLPPLSCSQREDHILFTRSLLNLSAHLDSLGTTSPAPTGPRELEPQREYAVVRPN